MRTAISANSVITVEALAAAFSKSAETDTPAAVVLTVIDQREETARFTIKATSPLSKLMNAYCDHAGMPVSKVHFEIFGEALQPDDTAQSLGLVHGDVIDVVTPDDPES